MGAQFVVSGDGTRIAYEATGAGPPLMLLHGAGKTRKDWHKVGYVERLKAEFTVIAVDIRGTGDSAPLAEIADYAIDKLCADLFAVADACGAERFAVWGFSFGGNIARYLASRSKRVTAAAFIGAPFGPAVDAAFDAYIDEFIVRYGAQARAYREGGLNAAERKSALKGRIPVWVACFQAMRLWPAVAPGDLRCPALLLVGSKNDNTLQWVEANRPALAEAGVQVAVVEGLNHPQEFTQIEQVYPVVAAFFKQYKES